MRDFTVRRQSIIQAGIEYDRNKEVELLTILQNIEENPALRRSSIVALRRLESQLARPALIQLLMTEHANENLRESAIKALGILGQPEDIDLLIGLSKSETIARFGRQAAAKAARKLAANIYRTKEPSESPMIITSNSSKSRRDVFICHASEDKPLVVEPLVATLENCAITTWYDRAEILWGDSLTGKVNEGLSISDFVLVVLSKNFLQKKWPKLELESAINIEASSGQVVVLPLLVGNESEKTHILKEYPILNHKLYLNWNGDPVRVKDHLYSRLKSNKNTIDPKSENVVEPFTKKKKQIIMANCKSCKGKGYIECPDCKGKGKKEHGFFGYDWHECQHCRGGGRKMCGVCQGEGKI